MKKENLLFGSLTLLRIVVGWHFLYEGLVKIANPAWTAAPFLSGSRWIFGGIFQVMVNNHVLMSLVNMLNTWGLTLIGIALILGIFTRLASFSGAFLMILYFVAYPPFPGYMQGVVAEGSYLWVNRNLIEMVILIALGFVPISKMFGIDRLHHVWKELKIHKPIPDSETAKQPGKDTASLPRRELLRDLLSVPVLGAFAYAVYRKKQFSSWEEKFLASASKTDASSGATVKSFEFTSLQSLKAQCPHGKLGNLDLSRLIAGGNLIGGWAHSRDLLYVSELVKAYHHDDKVIQTLALAEKCGINALLCNPALARIIHKYWHEAGGKIQFISDCQLEMDFLLGAKQSIALGASAAYCGGALTDQYVPAGKFDIIRKGLDMIRAAGIPAGIGAHRIESIEGCVAQGIIPDFWMKTVHNYNYWSAMPDKTEQDNKFDYNPARTIEFMNGLEQPWIGFKVLAAGAISPEAGFKYAFENGADFITVGMYDFQVVNDVNLVNTILPQVQKRKRPWCG